MGAGFSHGKRVLSTDMSGSRYAQSDSQGTVLCDAAYLPTLLWRLFIKKSNALSPDANLGIFMRS